VFQNAQHFHIAIVGWHKNERTMKQILYIFIGLTILSCQNNSEQISSVIKSPKTGQEIILSSKIDSIEISQMTVENLRLLRNEIFARHGYIFKSQELTDYFSKFDWYQPNLTSDQVDKKLSETDRYNISLIKSLESDKKQNLIKWDNELQSYLDLIPMIKLPLDFECENGFDIPELDYENDLIKKYKPEGATIIGKLYQDKVEVALIYGYPADIFYPLISVIDKSGEELREVRFFKLGNCVGDAGYSATTKGTITIDFKIKTTTEITTWDSENEDSEKEIQTFEDEINIK
jgi:hypothetical protein